MGKPIKRDSKGLDPPRNWRAVEVLRFFIEGRTTRDSRNGSFRLHREARRPDSMLVINGEGVKDCIAANAGCGLMSPRGLERRRFKIEPLMLAKSAHSCQKKKKSQSVLQRE